MKIWNSPQRSQNYNKQNMKILLSSPSVLNFIKQTIKKKKEKRNGINPAPAFFSSSMCACVHIWPCWRCVTDSHILVDVEVGWFSRCEEFQAGERDDLCASGEGEQFVLPERASLDLDGHLAAVGWISLTVDLRETSFYSHGQGHAGMWMHT